MDETVEFLLNKLEITSQSLPATFDLALDSGSKEAKDLSPFMEMKQRLEGIKKKFEEDMNILEVASNSRSVKEFDDTIKNFEKNKTQRMASLLQSEEYLRFKKCLEEKLGSRNSSLKGSQSKEVLSCIEEESTILDPLTKQPISDPVRNIICGHHYERSSVLQGIQLYQGFRCPVMGCGNRELLTEDSIEPDHLMKTQLEKRL